MASATKAVEEVAGPPVLTNVIVLTLSVDEAETLLAATSKVGGSPHHRRGHFDAIRASLTQALGASYWTTDAYKYLSGAGIFFADETT